MMKIQNSLNPLFQNLMSSKILHMFVNETAADCANCTKAYDQRFKVNYKPHLKCCTFVPFIPNFSVGAILSLNLKGAEVIRKKIKHKEFCIPLGVFPSFLYQFKFLNKKETAFGNDQDLLCHYFDNELQQCGIWNYRGVVCTSFFCRSSYGKKGQNFWSEMKEYLSYVEMCLAEDCLVMQDFSPRDVSDQLDYLNKRDFNSDEQVKVTLSDEEFKKKWNGYDDPEKFYKNCYKMVSKMNRSQFNEILGQQGGVLERNVLKAFQEIRK